VPVSFTLANGLDARVQPADCGADAAFVIDFAVGEDHDPANRSGLVQVIGRLAGSQLRGSQVEVSRRHTTFSFTSPREQILKDLDGFAGCLIAPAWSGEALEAAKAQVLEGIERRSGGDPTLSALTFAAESVAPSAGRGRRGGIASEVAAIDRAAVREFWKTHFTGGSARLVLVGAIDGPEARARIERAWAGLPSGAPPPARAPGDLTVTGTLVMGETPSAVAIAVPAPPLTDRGFPAFLLHAARLATEGPGPRDWAVRYDPLDDPDVLFVTASVPPGEQPEPAAERIRKAMAPLLARPLAPADVVLAKERFAPLLAQEDEAAGCGPGPGALALAIARRLQLERDGLPTARALEAVTPAQFQDAAAYFAPTRTAAVIAGGAVR
jgi:predicted Zn-dependent peptidase